MKFPIISIILIFIISCNDDKVETIKYSSNKSLYVALGYDTNVRRHYYPCFPEECFPPAHDCFDDIIVYPEKKPLIVELDRLISENEVHLFFQDTLHLQLFPGLKEGNALSDLKNQITTLRKLILNDTTICYYIRMHDDTTQSPDYGY